MIITYALLKTSYDTVLDSSTLVWAYNTAGMLPDLGNPNTSIFTGTENQLRVYLKGLSQ